MPRVQRREGSLVIRKTAAMPSLLFGGLFALLGIGFQVLLIVEYLGGSGVQVDGRNDPTESMWSLLMPVPFWTIGLAFLLNHVNARYRLGEALLEQYDLFGRKTASLTRRDIVTQGGPEFLRLSFARRSRFRWKEQRSD